MKIDELGNELITLMRSKNPLAVIETFEESRAVNLISQIASDKKVNRIVFTWTITQGLKQIPAGDDPAGTADNPLAVLEEIDTHKTNGHGIIYVLLDFDKYFPDHPDVIRKVRDLSTSLKNTKKSIIFVSPSFKIPDDLQKSIAIYDLPFPSREEIEARILSVINGVKNQIADYREELKIDHSKSELKQLNDNLNLLIGIEQKLFSQWNENKTALIDACLGLTDEEIENIISRSVVKSDLNISAILAEKKQIIKKSGSLQYFETETDLSAIGGLDILKEYADRAAHMFSQEAKDFGIDAPRGILLVGPSGTGKSLFVKAISNVMKQPLLNLDLASKRTKWFGESGQNLIKDLKTAHAIQPAILWIDEIDKSISRSGGQEMHSEDSSMLGILLTDMEEKPGLFTVATCNNPYNLPPELLNRFEKVFFVDLPTEKERAEIFAIQIKAKNRDPSKIDLGALSTAAIGYSGREIRNAVKEALSIAFTKNTDLTTEILIEVVKNKTPVSVQKKEENDAIRKWAGQNAEPASRAETGKPAAPAGVRKLEVL